MHFMKLALSVMVVFLCGCTKERKFCSPVGDKTVCQACTCPRGEAIPGAGGGPEQVACPDGAKPMCQQVAE